MSEIAYQALREIAKHQRLTEESASYARTNHSLTLDEACTYLIEPLYGGFFLPGELR